LVRQREQLGTAHAVKIAEKKLSEFSGDVLILYGDVPLIAEKTLRSFLDFHRAGSYALSVLTALFEHPNGYGRVIRDPQGHISRVIEDLDTTPEQARINEINSGMYLLKKELLFNELRRIQKNQRKKEYYLTDLIEIIAQQGGQVGGFCIDRPQEVMGINSQRELAVADHLARIRVIEEWIAKGVLFVDPGNVYVDRSVILSAGTTVGQGCVLRGRTIVKTGAHIDVGSVLVDARVDSGAHIRPYCVVEACHIQSNAQVGPFAHLRPGSVVGHEAKVGNFVEMKKSTLGRGAKANHLSYLGDTIIGAEANVGAGTITCNYDGIRKHPTVIGARSFIGSGSQLIAPVKLGADAWIGAGSTITKDVPASALAVTRVDQVTIKGWAQRKRARKRKKR
jgi:bifunctional UDP-N-acetylglucosamine pyrophosphorylase/glucosamine-1-phosphate N-acetyltransferase